MTPIGRRRGASLALALAALSGCATQLPKPDWYLRYFHHLKFGEFSS